MHPPLSPQQCLHPRRTVNVAWNLNDPADLARTALMLAGYRLHELEMKEDDSHLRKKGLYFCALRRVRRKRDRSLWPHYYVQREHLNRKYLAKDYICVTSVSEGGKSMRWRVLGNTSKKCMRLPRRMMNEFIDMAALTLFATRWSELKFQIKEKREPMPKWPNLLSVMQCCRPP